MTANAKKPASRTACSDKLNERSFPEILANEGNNNCAKTNARMKAISDINMDSPRNCRTSEFFSAPSTFLTPTSADRFEERAVERFMKLIQAINKVNTAIEA